MLILRKKNKKFDLCLSLQLNDKKHNPDKIEMQVQILLKHFNKNSQKAEDKNFHSSYFYKRGEKKNNDKKNIKNKNFRI